VVALLPAVLTTTALLVCCVQGAGEEAARHARDVADAAKEKYEELKVGVYCLEGAYCLAGWCLTGHCLERPYEWHCL
jgi:hypothetical protein